MTVRFSVFIPVWNDTRWLPGAIECMLAQSHQDWELVIGDNASTEPVEALVRGYDDARIRYHRWATHVDFASNANRTLSLATMDWVQYLSADDRLEPGCLAAMASTVEAAEAAGTPLAIVLTACRRVDHDGNLIEDQRFFRTWRIKHLPTGTYGAGEWLRHCAAPGGTPWNIGSMAIARSALVMAGGFFREEVGFAPDLEVAARLSAYGPVAYIAEPLFRYTVRRDSISAGLAMSNLERETLPPVSAAIASALAVHEHRRTVTAEERRYIRSIAADELIARALRHRYREGGRGRWAAFRDVRRATRYSLGWCRSPRQVARAVGAIMAPAWMLGRLAAWLRGHGRYL